MCCMLTAFSRVKTVVWHLQPLAVSDQGGPIHQQIRSIESLSKHMAKRNQILINLPFDTQ
jgi:hypothetical protein